VDNPCSVKAEHRIRPLDNFGNILGELAKTTQAPDHPWGAAGKKVMVMSEIRENRRYCLFSLIFLDLLADLLTHLVEERPHLFVVGLLGDLFSFAVAHAPRHQPTDQGVIHRHHTRFRHHRPSNDRNTGGVKLSVYLGKASDDTRDQLLLIEALAVGIDAVIDWSPGAFFVGGCEVVGSVGIPKRYVSQYRGIDRKWWSRTQSSLLPLAFEGLCRPTLLNGSLIVLRHGPLSLK